MSVHDIAKVERIEMYLKSVLVIGLAGHRVTTTRVADAMGVSLPSASEMLKRLEQQGYLEASSDGPRLTAAGAQIATRVVRRLRLAERLLTDVLGLDLLAVYDEACKMEHVISPAVEARLDAVLGLPATCPHGHPIPPPDGRLEARRDRMLAAFTNTGPARITALPEERTDLLRAALAAGLTPGALVQVEASATPRGPLMVRIGEARRTVPRDVSEQTWAEPAAPESATGTGGTAP